MPIPKQLDRAKDLPAKFTKEERECYQWLYDAGVKQWVVDLLNKKVMYVDSDDLLHKYSSLVEFAKAKGRKQ